MHMDQEIYDATWSLLDSNPDLQESIELVLNVDSEHEQWEFDDVKIDPGTFGKLVDRRIIRQDGNTYTVADHKAVHNAVTDFQRGKKKATSADRVSDSASVNISVSKIRSQVQARGEELKDAVGPWVHERSTVVTPALQSLHWNIVGLIIALTAVVGMRSLIADSVFRDGNIVSPANDPYYYRYVQAEMLEHADGITDIETLTELGEEGTRPLTHVLNWWIPELFGSSQTVADWTAGLLPVILAVVAGAVIYMLAVKVTADARVGIIAVLLYAVAPVHLVYTTVGFLEHRAHQYFWLILMAFTLAWLAVDVRQRVKQGADPEQAVSEHLWSRRTWVMTGVFTLAVAVTPHFWGGSPLHFVPVAGYIAVRVLLDVRNRVPPLHGLAPVLIGLGVGGQLAYVPHAVWEWRPMFAVITPLFIFGVGLVIALYAELGMRLEVSPVGLLAGEGMLGAGGLVAFWRLFPEEFTAARERADDLFFREGAVETGSLLESIQRPLIQIGPSFYLGIVGIIIGLLVVRRDYRPGWLLLTVFTLYYLLLATIQIRFAAHLVMFVSVFAGIAVLFLLSRINLVRPVQGIVDATAASVKPRQTGLFTRIRSPTVPDKARTGILVLGVLAVVISGAFLSLEPILNDITHEEEYEAAVEFNEQAEVLEQEYPENFVLSRWGDSRMYNYFVNGEARSYGYAQSNFEEFLNDIDPDAWYNEFEGRVGYIAVPPVPGDPGEETVYHQLYDEAGLNDASTSHYQYLGNKETLRMFAVVEGATIAAPNASDELTATTSAGEEDAYTISEPVDEEPGKVTVAYPGTYVVASGEKATTVQINDSDVYDGNEIEVSFED